ncbi:MAG: serpin family protein [Firmicutes bacterium]|nr:serpin family protein [Bacillota bacterium]
MKKNIIVVLALALLLLPLAGCALLERNEVIAAKEVDARLVEANTGFAFRLFNELLKGDEENVFYSPASVALALSMTYNGAAGDTEKEMAHTMGIENLTLDELNAANKDLLTILQNPDQNVETSIANSLWPAEGAPLVEEFTKRNEEFYNADVTRVDFTSHDAVDIVNGWVADNTNNRIEKLFDELKPTTRLVLVNAIFFKGGWTHTFDKEATADADFHLPVGRRKTVPMMYQQNTLSCLEGDNFKAVRLPYGQERVSMYVFVPETELSTFTDQLTSSQWEEWLNSFSEKEDATVFLPRFSAEYKTELINPLMQLGMVAAFGGGADFSGITPGGGWFISQIVHQANLDVNEEGTEAAAATGVAMDESAPLDPFTLRADRPFFFAICDDLTGTILFMGTITNPEVD